MVTFWSLIEPVVGTSGRGTEPSFQMILTRPLKVPLAVSFLQPAPRQSSGQIVAKPLGPPVPKVDFSVVATMGWKPP